MFDTIMTLLHTYPTQAIAVWAATQYLWSCFVDSIPEPDTMGSPWYKFFYKFSHRLAGNNSEAKKTF